MTNKNLTDVFLEYYNTLPDIEISNGKTILSYYGGMCHRTSRNLIFAYDKQIKDVYLKAIELSEHNVCNDEQPSSHEIIEPKQNKTKFEDYKDVF